MAKQSAGAEVPVLLTRPLAQSQFFAAALVARFGARVRPVLSPLMAPVFLSPALPEGPFAGVIFTSATGVAAAKGLSLPKRAWCVGGQTAATARAAGFQSVSADGDAAALVAAVRADPPPGRILHLRGEDTRGDVADLLNSAGIETVSLVMYRQAPQPLTAEAINLLTAGAAVVPLFSPRTAQLFRQALPRTVSARLCVAAMSPAVAEGLDGLVPAAMVVARRPDADAMLEALGQLLEMRPLP